LPTSPAINSGTASNAPNVDLDSNPRPVGAAVDIGAYEYCVGAECGVLVEDCDNTIDDDGDGDIDCAAHATCQPGVENCTNGTDDDGDGDIDCDDTDCDGHSACVPTSEEGGCGCRAADRSPPVLWLLVLLTWLGWRRQRRSAAR